MLSHNIPFCFYNYIQCFHLFTNKFTHSLYKCVLSNDYVLSMALGSGVTAVSKKDPGLAVMDLTWRCGSQRVNE